MGLRKGAPGKGGGTRPDHFSYTGVAHGLKGSFSAWLAGEPYWCDEAHEHKREDPGTKPCLGWLTGGALVCPRCRKLRTVKCIGWVPLYREEDLKPIIVIIHDTVADLVKDLHYPMHVLVGRVDAVSSVYVRKSDTPVSFRSDNSARQQPADITNDLLSMWGLPELNDWIKRGSRPTAVECEKVPGAAAWRLSVPPPTTDAESLAIDAHRNGEGEGASGVNDAFARAVRRAGKQPTNGKHPPAEGE
jgi:hypothetical protein